VVLKSLATLSDRTLAKFTGDEQFDGTLDILRLQGLLTAIDDQHAALTHDLIKSVRHNRIHRGHGFLRNPNLLLTIRAHLLEHTEDVGVESCRVATSLGLPLSSLFLFFL
jgi:hypothetical protein